MYLPTSNMPIEKAQLWLRYRWSASSGKWF